MGRGKLTLLIYPLCLRKKLNESYHECLWVIDLVSCQKGRELRVKPGSPSTSGPGVTPLCVHPCGLSYPSFQPQHCTHGEASNADYPALAKVPLQTCQLYGGEQATCKCGSFATPSSLLMLSWSRQTAPVSMRGNSRLQDTCLWKAGCTHVVFSVLYESLRM